MASLQDPLIAVPVSYLITGLLSAGARFIVSKEPPTIRRVIETIFLGGAAIFVSYPYLEEKGLSHGIINLVIAMISFAAKDILEVIIKLWEQIKTDPLALLRDFLNKLKPGGGS